VLVTFKSSSLLVRVEVLSQGRVVFCVVNCLFVVFVLKPSLGEISFTYFKYCRLVGEKLLKFF